MITLCDEIEWIKVIPCGWSRLWSVDGYKVCQAIAEYGAGGVQSVWRR
jgi:UDP-GlcNAc3NAcA epimerase